MKTIFSTFFVIFSVFCLGQKNSYNDWFDKNLKGKPKTITEVSIFPLTDFTNSSLKLYLDSKVNQMLFIDEFHFDSLGLISKEFHKGIFDTVGLWTDYKTIKTTHFKDSIIMIGHFPNGQESWKEKRYLDKNGFLLCKINISSG